MLFQEYEPKEIYIGISDRFASVWIQIKGSRQEISVLLHNSHLFSRGPWMCMWVVLISIHNSLFVIVTESVGLIRLLSAETNMLIF